MVDMFFELLNLDWIIVFQVFNLGLQDFRFLIYEVSDALVLSLNDFSDAVDTSLPWL